MKEQLYQNISPSLFPANHTNHLTGKNMFSRHLGTQYEPRTSISPAVANHSPDLSQITNFSLPALRLCVSPTQSNHVADTQSSGNNKLEGKITKRVFRYLPLRGEKSMHAIPEWGVVPKNTLIAINALITHASTDLCNHQHLFIQNVFHP